MLLSLGHLCPASNRRTGATKTTRGAFEKAERRSTPPTQTATHAPALSESDTQKTKQAFYKGGAIARRPNTHYSTEKQAAFFGFTRTTPC